MYYYAYDAQMMRTTSAQSKLEIFENKNKNRLCAPGAIHFGIDFFLCSFNALKCIRIAHIGFQLRFILSVRFPHIAYYWNELLSSETNRRRRR